MDKAPTTVIYIVGFVSYFYLKATKINSPLKFWKLSFLNTRIYSCYPIN